MEGLPCNAPGEERLAQHIGCDQQVAQEEARDRVDHEGAGFGLLGRSLHSADPRARAWGHRTNGRMSCREFGSRITSARSRTSYSRLPSVGRHGGTRHDGNFKLGPRAKRRHEAQDDEVTRAGQRRGLLRLGTIPFSRQPTSGVPAVGETARHNESCSPSRVPLREGSAATFATKRRPVTGVAREVPPCAASRKPQQEKFVLLEGRTSASHCTPSREERHVGRNGEEASVQSVASSETVNGASIHLQRVSGACKATPEAASGGHRMEFGSKIIACLRRTGDERVRLRWKTWSTGGEDVLSARPHRTARPHVRGVRTSALPHVRTSARLHGSASALLCSLLHFSVLFSALFCTPRLRFSRTSPALLPHFSRTSAARLLHALHAHARARPRTPAVSYFCTCVFFLLLHVRLHVCLHLRRSL